MLLNKLFKWYLELLHVQQLVGEVPADEQAEGALLAAAAEAKQGAVVLAPQVLNRLGVLEGVHVLLPSLEVHHERLADVLEVLQQLLQLRRGLRAAHEKHVLVILVDQTLLPTKI